MKHSILRLATASLVLIASAGFAAPPELNVVEHQITQSSANETTPTLGNDGVSDLVVYTMRVVLPDGRLAPGDIWYQRVTPDGALTGPAWQVTADLTDDELNDVSGDYIVYTAYESTSSLTGTIMLYRISTYQLVPLAQEAPRVLEPRIYGNNVVWVQGPDGATQVMRYDLAWLGTAREPTLVAGPWPPANQVAIGSKYIVWTQILSGQADVWAGDMINAVRMQITRTAGIDETQPATSGEWITWQTQSQGATSIAIEAMNLATYDIRSVVLNDAYNVRPSIDGDLIAWESSISGNFDVFLYRLSDRQTFQVTTNPSDQRLNDVFGNKVAFVDLRNGSQDIYLASFNKSPLANAGADQTVHVRALVTLDGSGSTDPDLNYPLTYAWTLKRPAGSAAALLGADTATPSFTPDVMGDYVAELVVTDAANWPSLPDTVTISTTNTAPVAAAGDDQSLILLGSLVTLDGSTSYDPDGDAITFLWSFTSRPGGSAAVLSDPTVPKPTFVADIYGKYELSLAVTDLFGANASDAVIVSFENVKPVANAGVNQAVIAPSMVLLDGTASSDANGDPLTYQWNMVSKPDGSSAVLSNSTTAHPSFVADPAGQYVVSLVVSDGLLASDPSNVTITATSGSAAVIDVLRDTVNAINGLALASFKNPNMANALTNKIAATIRMIERGDYAEALDKVKNDIMSKTNGCATAGAPDKNDWITDCTAQAQVYPYLVEVMTMLQQMVP